MRAGRGDHPKSSNRAPASSPLRGDTGDAPTSAAATPLSASSPPRRRQGRAPKAHVPGRKAAAGLLLSARGAPTPGQGRADIGHGGGGGGPGRHIRRPRDRIRHPRGRIYAEAGAGARWRRKCGRKCAWAHRRGGHARAARRGRLGARGRRTRAGGALAGSRD
jgi:hypothetical protein